MIVPLKSELELTPEQQESINWADWQFHSHKWIETSTGYYKCEFCGNTHTSLMPTNIQPLCVSNPKVQAFFSDFLKPFITKT